MDASITQTPISIMRCATSSKDSRQTKHNKSVKFSERVTVCNGDLTKSNYNTGKLKTNIKKISENISEGWNLSTQLSMAGDGRKVLSEQRDNRQNAEILFPRSFPTLSRPSTSGISGVSLRNELRSLQDNYFKSAIHKKFHDEYPENAPDLRRTPDTRITLNEKRHVIRETGQHSYYFHG